MGFEFRRGYDFDHLKVARVLELAVADARRLVAAAAGLHPHSSDAFVLEQHPALQHVDELHGDVVVVPFAVRRFSGARADHMRNGLALGRALDAEIAVLEVATQAAALEAGAFAMTHSEASGHGAIILG